MPTAEQVRRDLCQRAIVGRVMLALIRSARGTYNRGGRNVSALFPDFIVVMAVRANDVRGAKPMSVSRLARVTGLPRANVRRSLSHLIRQKIIDKDSDGYVGNIEFVTKRVGSLQMKHAMRVIMIAADKLRDLVAILAMAILAS